MSAFNVMVATAAEDIADEVSLRARDIASETGESESAAHHALVTLIKKSIHASRPDVVDARTALYRVRFQLQPIRENAAIEADSDPEISDLDAPGTQLIRGLPAVALELRELAEAFHDGREIEGLGQETLAMSIRAFRPTLSRQKGDAIWRPRYSLAAADPSEIVQPVAGSLKGVRGGSRVREFWTARVHIVRAED